MVKDILVIYYTGVNVKRRCVTMVTYLIRKNLFNHNQIDWISIVECIAEEVSPRGIYYTREQRDIAESYYGHVLYTRVAEIVLYTSGYNVTSTDIGVYVTCLE